MPKPQVKRGPAMVREVIETTPTHIMVRETWDLKHPDCPFVFMEGDKYVKTYPVYPEKKHEER